MYELDVDTQIEATGEHQFRASVSDRFSIGNAPNGGYLAYLVLGAAMRAAPQPDPFSVTTHFLRTARPGPAEIHVEPVRLGRGHSTVQARLLQDGQEIVRQLSVVGDLSAIRGPTVVDLAPPVLPPPSACEWGRVGPTSDLSIADRLDVAMRPLAVSWMPGPDGQPRAHTEHAELAAWVRLKDGRPPDARSLVFFADALPPPVLNLSLVSTPWVPTLELTVHVRARPAAGFLRAVFTTHALIEGYLEEDGELWDSEGKLVAMSRQLARIHR